MSQQSSLIIASPDGRIEVEVDALTGMPRTISQRLSPHVRRALSVSLAAHVHGIEQRGWRGGLTYRDVTIESTPLVVGEISQLHKGTSDEYVIPVKLGALNGSVRYSLYPNAPYLEVSLELRADEPLPLRALDVAITVDGEPSESLIHIPGGMIRRGARVADLGAQPIGVSPLGGLRGSSGIIGIETDGVMLTIWPTQVAEIPNVVVSKTDGGVTIAIDTSVAAMLGPSNAIQVPLFTLDLQAIDFEGLRQQWPDWAARLGLITPASKPLWTEASCIYEAQIGTSKFWGGHHYTPYRAVQDLTDDLPRIWSLGFTVIQLMPHHPYPSYNVHDYADISTSYGDERQLVKMVLAAHALGMKVILDVLLHGVLDNEAVQMALEGIADGPLANRLDEVTGDSFGTDISDQSNYAIAWSRHIHDFSADWIAGSPVRTPLQELHPDWFARASDGSVTGVYTKAFDARHPEWQEYFRASMLNLIRALDIDGFRFDAPTYNNFANWAKWASARASLSPLGCVSLFVDLRRDIKALRPEALMYTEPSGHLLRRSMDVNYNYDEQWLVTALICPEASDQRGVINARQFMHWMEDRDSFLPTGSRTAHHIDSHDTFWWPQWGTKWRREQFGVDAVQALTVAFMTLDGPFMMFTGGEEGIEDELAMMGGLRRDYPSLWSTATAFLSDVDATGDLFIAQRWSDNSQLTVVVNFSADEARTLPERLGNRSETVGKRGFFEGRLQPYGYLVMRAPVTGGKPGLPAPPHTQARTS